MTRPDPSPKHRLTHEFTPASIMPMSPTRPLSPLTILVAMSSFVPSVVPAADNIDLRGAWRVELDPMNAGVAERWFAHELPGTITLPGSLQQHGLGDPVTAETKWTGSVFDRSYFNAPEYAPYREPGNIKVPFWLQPDTHYTGAAWFQREIEVPANWKGRRLVLTLERPHWKTTVWLDDRETGTQDALSVPHVHELGAAVGPGRHVLTIRVDNTHDPDLGENSHSISDHTQGNWNGIVGRITLSATAPVWIDDLQVYPRLRDRTAMARGRLDRLDGRPWPESVRIVGGAPTSASIDAPVAPDGSFSATCAFAADTAPWDELTPALHQVTASLPNGESRVVTVGFRAIAAESRQLTLNGRKLFLRGTLDYAAFPRTGHPPTEGAEWQRIFGVVKAHGLNHVRFHSWCPPEAAFVVADELGILLQVEVASWPNWSTALGDGKPVDAWIEAETARILRAYGNHPSFVMLCAGNEPGGPSHEAWLSRWVARQKASDPRRLYTAGAGWPELPENDYHVRSEPRIQQWLEELNSRINATPPETRTDYSDFIRARRVPVVSHEIGQWCAYPNLAEISKYTGYLKPRNFEIFRETLTARGLAAQADDFLHASGKLQALCYKEDIEAALRTPEMGGFQLLGLQDFPGQGTALVGVLDAFWEEKGYITPGEYRRFCHVTVPLARLDRRVFTAEEHLVADVEVAHYGAAPLTRAQAGWALVAEDGSPVAAGSFPPREVPIGGGNRLGRVDIALAALPVPARYRLVVTLDGTEFANDWDIWVYPPPTTVVQPLPGNVTVTSRFDAAALARLEAGETVWLQVPSARVAPDPRRGPIKLGFSSIFWNTAWTNGQAPHTLGILCDPRHPALASFPTDTHSNWHWWYIVSNAAPLILDGLPKNLRPTVQVIDDWFTNRRLGLAFEARVGPGRLLVTSIDLGDAVLDPVRRQLRASLLEYLAGNAFAPDVEVSPDQVRALMSE